MTRIFVVLAVFLWASCMPALAEPAQHSAPAKTAPAIAPETVPQLNPMDVPRWMGDAIGHILTGEDQTPDAPPIRQ